MTFAHPYALLFGLAALPTVLLYLRKVQWRRVSVGTGLFWDQVFAEQMARLRWQRWRRPASLVLQLAIVALIALALAEPQIPEPRHVVLVVDNGLHMQATDVKPSRLAAAKEAAGRLIAGMKYYDEIAIISAAQTPTVHSMWSSDKAKLREAVASVTAIDAATAMPATITLARRLEAERPGIKIVILSDACWPGAAEVAAQPGIELFRVGTVVGNAAITRLTARPTKADPHVQQVLVEVRNFADESMTGRLLVALSGKEIDAVPLTIAANGRWQHVFQFTSDRPEQLTARLEPSDVLAADNEAAASLQQSDIDVAPMHDLRVPGNVGVAIDSLLLRVAGPPLWMVLTVAAALLCAVEWCLYQRRWVG